MDQHATMCEATGGKVQKNKVMVHCWKSKNDQIFEVPMNTKMK